MKRFILLVSCAFAAVSAMPQTLMPSVLAATLKPGEGSDLELGGFGAEEGHFVRLRDMTFGPDGSLYTLETGGKSGETMGVGRVQVFNAKGEFQRSFSLGDDAQGDKAVNEKNEDGSMAAQRIAVDGQGNVYVSFPIAGDVRVFDGAGKKLSDITLPNAMALARTGDGKIVAIASRRFVGKGGWQWSGGDSMFILNSTAIEKTIPLAQSLWNVQDVAVAPNGEIVVLGAEAQPKYNWNPQTMIWRFDPNGKVVGSIGTGITTRVEDGSEPLHSITVSKNGDITAMTYGNPGKTIRYSADGKTVTSNFGWFKWADSWSEQSGYTILALDANDRLWVGVTQQSKGRPVALRVKEDFFEPKTKNVIVADARVLGFAPKLKTPLVDNIAYDSGKPIETDVVVAPSKRNLQSVNVAYRVFDTQGQVVDKGEKTLALTDGQEAQASLNWTPPRFGSYSFVADYKAGDDVLKSQAIHFGVTPRYANMPVLEAGQSNGSWEDTARQAFAGLNLVRLHPDKGLDKLDKDLDAAQKAGDVALVQLTDKKDNFTPARATEVMNRIKGRVQYIELFNEPNFSFSPQDFFERAKPVIAAIRAVDPDVKIMGPSVVNLSIGWAEELYKSGVGKILDIVAFHDYEGHESISPEHWIWKFGALRAIMAKNGDGDKPIWQTERAISAVRGGLLTGYSQAIRITLHRDLLSSLGVPDDHNAHYYLNQGGYSDVPSYVWTDRGPLPAALATRTRAAMLARRPFVGSLNFGATGNTLFMGERYRDKTGETISLRNIVGAPMKVQFTAPAGLKVFDAWGNALPAALNNGVLTLELGQLPTYVQLSGAGTLQPKPWNWGANLALNAKVSVEGKADNDITKLTNGVIETIHDGNPLGGTDGKAVVRLSGFSPEKPALVSLDLPAAARCNSIIVRGLRADNQFCALRDFDVQVRQNGDWKTVATYKSTYAPTVLAQNADATAITFYGDDNAYVLHFPAVQSDGVRLVVRSGTYGFEPDKLAYEQVFNKWGGANTQGASLREIEVYNAP